MRGEADERGKTKEDRRWKVGSGVFYPFDESGLRAFTRKVVGMSCARGKLYHFSGEKSCFRLTLQYWHLVIS
jgi:hypothetical protein